MRLFYCLYSELPHGEDTLHRLKKEFNDFKILLRSVPSSIVAPFVAAVMAMNLLANKSINFNIDWLALDCGIFVSWIAFLTMDIITKRFGPKAATQLSIFAILINLTFSLMFFAISKIPGTWSQAQGNSDTINNALNETIGGTWYVVHGSALAFVTSAIINNFSNWAIGLLFKKNPDGAIAFHVRAYASTAIAQFVDNLIFALCVSHIFFGWNISQCIVCAATGMLAELLLQMAFSHFGYKICKKMSDENVGQEYLKCINGEQE